MKTIYLTIRVDLESANGVELTEELVQDFVAGAVYDVISRTEDVNVIDTELCDINE